MFLPLYSHDFNPTEKAFARLKAMLRTTGKRTVSELWFLIGSLRVLAAGTRKLLQILQL